MIRKMKLIVEIENFRFQTFGVITMRVDTLDGGNLCPARPSASTQAQSTSHSSLNSLSMVNKNNCPYLPDMGTEVEIHNLLIIDQNTFEGNSRLIVMCISQTRCGVIYFAVVSFSFCLQFCTCISCLLTSTR